MEAEYPSIAHATAFAAITAIPIPLPANERATSLARRRNLAQVLHDHKYVTDAELGDVILHEVTVNTNGVVAAAQAPDWVDALQRSIGALQDGLDAVKLEVGFLRTEIAGLQAGQVALQAGQVALQAGQVALQARQTNSTCGSHPGDLLVSILNNAGAVSPDFPQTVQEIYTLTGAALGGLLTFYGLPSHGTNEERRHRFSRFIGADLKL
jgi:hypothetical protein